VYRHGQRGDAMPSAIAKEQACPRTGQVDEQIAGMGQVTAQ